MNKLFSFLQVAALLIMMQGGQSFVMASDQTTRPTLQWALDNPDKLTPEVLRKPENAELVKGFKKHALAKPSMDVVVPLLNVGDPDVIRDSVSRYHSRSLSYYPDRTLAKSTNPEIIALIGDDLNRSESTAGEIRGDILIKPLSLSSAVIIRRIIMQSGSFSPAVQSWIKGLSPTITDDEFRQRMKVWWNQNKSLLEAGHYAQVQPPR
jgi:hypothetical protein